MYTKDAKCQTCNIDKPPRSKHCRVCNHCVEKFDHHCIWINQCVGPKNYKWFLLFLFLHILITLYGTYAGIAVFFGEMKVIKEHGAGFVNTRTGEAIDYTIGLHMQYFFLNQEKTFGCIFLVCMVMTVVLAIFFNYHLKLVKSNRTTNESFKVSDFEKHLQREHTILSQLLEECEEWKPKSADQTEMPKITIDEVVMPNTKAART